MKITLFNGSHKNEKGNTQIMIDAFAAGARDAGAVVESIPLARLTIKPCRACYSCWVKTPGVCVHKDDMSSLVKKILESDCIGFATPVYVDNVTGIMKLFLDRLIIIGDPHWERDASGECRHGKRYEKPDKMIVISNCGFPEQSHFEVLRVLFKRMARNFHSELVAEIYRGGGALLQSTEPMVQPALERYKNLLHQAGREVVEQGALSVLTAQELEKPLLPPAIYVDTYVNRVNQLWDELLKKSSMQAELKKE